MKSLRARVEKFSHDGRGIARVNGKITFIEGALPDETVSFQVIASKKKYDEGHVIDVIDASIDRVPPRCRHYHQCGGCSLQHLNPTQQIAVKEDLVLDLLLRVARVTPERVDCALVSSSWHYRNKARLSVSFDTKSKQAVVGFRAKHQPNRITPIQDCSVLNPIANQKLAPLLKVVNQLRHAHLVHAIDVAMGEENAIACLFRVKHALSPEETQVLVEFAEQQLVRVDLLTLDTGVYSCLSSRGLEQGLTYTLPDYALLFRFEPTDFTQINPQLNRLMVNAALEWLDLNQQDVVLDLFCGLGNFTLPIARFCKQVIGLEGDAGLVSRAKANARLNGIENAFFHAADLNQPIIIPGFDLQLVNKLVLDPSRAGAVAVVERIEDIDPDCIVYVSCDAATFARDCGILVHSKGYRLISLRVMDMFAHTAHVETIGLFQKER